MAVFRLIILPFLVAFLGAGPVEAQGVHVIPLQGDVDPGMLRFLNRTLSEAEAAGPNTVVVLHINTFGGMLDVADSISHALMRTPLTTVAFIDNNAASAGALIALSCDSIYMAPTARMGAASVVSGETGELAPEKYQSYMRAIMATAATAHGRNPRIAQKMVSPHLDIPGLSPMGEVLTLATPEAIANGYAEAQVPNLPAALARLGTTPAQATTHTRSTTEVAMAFLMQPWLTSILMTLFIGGLFFEMKAPGLGFPALVAGVAGVLLFAPHYVYGATELWELGLFAIGIALLVAELFVIPGFGVAGVLGIFATVGGLAIALMRNQGLDFSNVDQDQIIKISLTVVFSLIFGGIGVWYVAKRWLTSKRAHPIVDETVQDKEDGYTSLDPTLRALLGQTATALTDLRPVGFLDVAGRRVEAVSNGAWVKKGATVRILNLDGTSLVVQEEG